MWYHKAMKSSQNNELLTRAIDTIYPSKSALEKVLASNKKLRIYTGIDPTADYVHLGHATNYLLLRRFHALGHKIIVLVGDFTAMVGDPSDKSAARKQLTASEIKQNLKTFKEQIGKILDFEDTKNPIEFVFNSKWLSKLSFNDLMDLASNFTVQQMIERDNFSKRIAQNKPVYIHELFYPLMQGYDSVALEADVEIGGTDQTFNMLAGRTLVKRFQNREKFVITTKLLENPLTGEKLMSKSLGTGISIKEPASEMYGKVMRLPDQAIVECFIGCTEVPMDVIKSVAKDISMGANPRDTKASLAREIVRIYHGEEAAKVAEQAFNDQFRDKKQPTDIPRYNAKKGTDFVDIVIGSGLASSKSDFRRLVMQAGIKHNNKVVMPDVEITVKDGDIIQVGKRRFVKLRVR